MEGVKWIDTREKQRLRAEIKKEVVKEFKECIGCADCKRMNRITEDDLVYKEKQRFMHE